MSQEVATGTLRSITVPAVIASLDDVMAFVHEELEKQGCPAAVGIQIDIALEELFVNVCHYAYDGQDVPGECEVSRAFDPKTHRFTVVLKDKGTPFNPLTRVDPTKPSSIQEAKIGGLGIFMAKKSVDKVLYDRIGDTNVVTFHKSW